MDAASDPAPRYWRWALIAPVAATLAAAVTVGLILKAVDSRRGEHPGRSVTRKPGGASDPVTTGPLNEALAGATAATWDLARSASEPAARISRQVIDIATSPEVSPVPTASNADAKTSAVTVSLPSLGSLAPDSGAAAAMLQQVGDRLATGVRPLSSTARHAFGFLLGPAPVKPEAPAHLPSEKGA